MESFLEANRKLVKLDTERAIRIKCLRMALAFYDTTDDVKHTDVIAVAEAFEAFINKPVSWSGTWKS